MLLNVKNFMENLVCLHLVKLYEVELGNWLKPEKKNCQKSGYCKSLFILYGHPNLYHKPPAQDLHSNIS